MGRGQRRRGDVEGAVERRRGDVEGAVGRRRGDVEGAVGRARRRRGDVESSACYTSRNGASEVAVCGGCRESEVAGGA